MCFSTEKCAFLGTPPSACATIGLLAPGLLRKELAGELTVAALQQRASGVVSAGAGGPFASHEPRLALHARETHA